MSPILDIVLLAFCAVPALAGPVRRNAELPTAPAGLLPSAFSIEPSESALLASIYAAASTVLSIDTCTEMPATTDKSSTFIGQSTRSTSSLATAALPTSIVRSDLAHYAAESSVVTSETLFSYAPQASETTTERVASQPTSHTTGRRTTTLTEFTTVAAGYGQQTGSASMPSSNQDAASTSSSTFSTTSVQPVPSSSADTVSDQSSSAVLASSSTTSLSAYTSAPAPYAVSANSSMAIAPSQYPSTCSSIAITSGESSSSADVSAMQVTSMASRYGGSNSASTTSQSSQTVVLSSSTSSNSIPLVYGSITLTYSTPSETSVSINPTQYVSTYPTVSTEDSTSHHHHHHSATESASAPMAESSSAFGYSGPAPSSTIAPSLPGSGTPLPTASDSSHRSVPSTSVLAIIPINPSSYPSHLGAEDVDSNPSAQRLHGQSGAPTASAPSGSAPHHDTNSDSINSRFATTYVTVTATDAGPTVTDFVTVSVY